MLFADDYLGIPQTSRDALAFWSDVVGCIGFLLALVGLGVTLLVNYRIREVKIEADKTLRRFVLGQYAADMVSARHALELGREACYAKHWDRAKAQFDFALGIFVRLSRLPDFPDDLRPPVNERAADARECSKWMVSRSTANLSPKRQAILDRVIERMVELEIQVRSSLEVKTR